jgi:hypothetical protein
MKLTLLDASNLLPIRMMDQPNSIVHFALRMVEPL